MHKTVLPIYHIKLVKRGFQPIEQQIARAVIDFSVCVSFQFPVHTVVNRPYFEVDRNTQALYVGNTIIWLTSK